MKKKGDLSITLENAGYLILLIVFLALIFFGVLDKKESSATYTDYYAKETARLINYARPGDVITIDIHDATKIAKKNGVTSDSEIVSFENSENAVCFKLSLGRKTCYRYFNNVDIVNWKIERGIPINLLSFEVIEKQKIEEDDIGGQNGLA